MSLRLLAEEAGYRHKGVQRKFVRRTDHGRFCCRKCKNRWTSHRVTIEFVRGYKGIYVHRRYTQVCDRCKTRTEPHWFKGEWKRLIERIVATFMTPRAPAAADDPDDDGRDNDQDEEDEDLSHHVDQCEACDEEVCRRRGAHRRHH